MSTPVFIRSECILVLPPSSIAPVVVDMLPCPHDVTYVSLKSDPTILAIVLSVIWSIVL